MKKIYNLEVAFLNSVKKEIRNRTVNKEKLLKRNIKQWKKIVDERCDKVTKKKLLNAFQFSKGINYKHKKISQKVYFSHLVRVSSLSMDSQKREVEKFGILGLLHNILEVSDVKKDYIIKKFGKKIYEQINILKVNRIQQWKASYKKKYYNRIFNGSKKVKVIKCFDKLDNLFLLKLNKNKKIKLKYLAEIKKYIIPLVNKNIPEITLYCRILYKYNYDLLK